MSQRIWGKTHKEKVLKDPYSMLLELLWKLEVSKLCKHDVCAQK